MISPTFRSSVPVVRAAEETVFLDGYLRATDLPSTSRFSSVVPADAYTDTYSPVGPAFAVDRLSETHIVDVINKDYSDTYRVPNVQGGLQELIEIEDVVRRVEGNIVALTLGRGLPLGTGFLIGADCVLTARHVVQGLDPVAITARLHFQKSPSGIMDFGIPIPVVKITRANRRLDFAVLILQSPVTSFRKVSFGGCSTGSSLLFHHPRGGPKKVSVHDRVETGEYEEVGYSAFHDSYPGSSGGVYVNAHGRVFALHTMNREGQTQAVFIENILEQMRSSLRLPKPRQTQPLPILEYPSDSIGWLETNHTSKTRPSWLPEIPVTNMARHHIIPKGDMELFWMFAQEFPPLRTFLNKIFASKISGSGEGLTINDVVWGPWNLFVGPEQKIRSDDPKDSPEPTKPLSFDSRLWNALRSLHEKIEKCWDERQRVSGAEGGEHPRFEYGQADFPNPVRNVHSYGDALREMLVHLNKMERTGYFDKNPHWTSGSDWTASSDWAVDSSRCVTKGVCKLRKHSRDGRPMDGSFFQNETAFHEAMV